tara:strand:- start:1084 stop:1248 length:165 start_codon:yes stop_codon:yes gene_type:complete
MDIETKMKKAVEQMDVLEKPVLEKPVLKRSVVSKPEVQERFCSSKKLFIKTKDK